MLAKVSMKNKLLLTVLPLTLVICLANLLLVYQSSKASTEEMAGVDLDTRTNCKHAWRNCALWAWGWRH
ncbi:hypothetical protein ACW9IF_01115 [Pseudomonas tolaasii]